MARDKTDKTDRTRVDANASKEALYQAAVREAEDMLRIATSADYDPHRETLTSLGSWNLFKDAVGLASRARTSPIAHDAMCFALAEMIASRSMPPEAACDWLAAYLRGDANRPKDKAGRKKELALHNAIWMVVRDLTEQGMRPTRNDVTSSQDSACDAVAEAMQRLPEASFVFLYRDAMGWTKSVYQMVLKYGIKPRLTGENKTLIWNVLSANEDESYLRPYIDLDAETLPLEDSIVICWAWYVEEYNRQLAAGVPFLALRYNELNRDREASLNRLFAHCGLPVEDVIGGLAAFEADSQAGTKLSLSVTVERMSDDQVARARSLLAGHPRQGNPDRLLADIYSPVPKVEAVTATEGPTVGG